jgi:putative SOS response-associated peptidase YedK
MTEIALWPSLVKNGSMCGRFTLHHAPDEIAARFAVQQVLFQPTDRYNIAPTQQIAVVTQNARGDDQKLLEGYRWGLIPSWAKDPSIGSKMINARAETVASKPAFRSAMKRRRCLIPADGFYEWQAQGKSKQPMHIRFRDGRIYAFAGLWEEWEEPGEGPLRTCTIITGEPNDLLASIHNRMAVILKEEDEEAWLDPDLPVEHALKLLRVFPEKELEAVAVDKRVGNVAYDSPECIAPIEQS